MEKRTWKPLLGKFPKKFNHKNLQMARYMPTLITPPVAVDHASRLPVNIGMMGNDVYGNCTVAAAGHAVQSWTTYAERGMLTIPDAQIKAAYLAISPNDDGAYMLDVLNYWRKTGIGPDKIEAFVELGIANITQAELAIDYFGSAYIGMSLPDLNTFGPWTTVTGPPNMYNGHAVVLLAYDRAKQIFKVATWGDIWDMSYAWYLKYCDEGYAVLNDIAVIAATGKTDEGFSYAELLSDLAHIGDPISPPVPVPPEPTPTPTPVPVVNPQIAITTVLSANYVVSLNGVGQKPTHTSPFEAAEHASNLKLANPGAYVSFDSTGKWKVTLK